MANKHKTADRLPTEQTRPMECTTTRLKWLICLLLVIVTLLAYWQVFGCKFIEGYDDDKYVTTNPFLAKGLSPAGLHWAFTTFRCANWHPLTWLSLMLDRHFYGNNPLGYHLTNLLFHIACTLVLFILLNRITGSVWKSGFVAALFAVHPLHVQSVAWVAERKDVLSTFFYFLTIYAYVAYIERPCVKRYVLVLSAFLLGLLAKPMLVSLPLVLLLLDYWPLKRMSLRWKLIWEKIPLFVLSAVSCVITIIAQNAGGAVNSLHTVPAGYRIGNALVSYVAYLVKTVWPSGLAIYYPHPAADLPIWQMGGALVLLAAISVLVVKQRLHRPYLATGWLWYLITLLPVIGIVQVGGQAMADRYSYVPLIGIFVIIAWGVPGLLAKRRSAVRYVPGVAMALVVVLIACTCLELRFWHDSLALFDRAVKVTQNNSVAYNNRGVAWLARGKPYLALADFSKATEIEPTYGEAQCNLALSLIQADRTEEGIERAQTALQLGWDNANSHYALALGYFNIGKLALAAEQCTKALELDPSNSSCHYILGAALVQLGSVDEAIPHLQEAADLDATNPAPHGALAVAYFTRKHYASAWEEVHVFESLGGQPDPRFLADLSRAMPDPGQ